MSAISILNEVKNKVLNAEYYNLLKRAYDLQNENIEQLKSIIENLKKNYFLLDEYVLSRPLEKIVHSFMEILLPCFVLERTNIGYSLSVQFDEKSEAIWTREARMKLRSRMQESVVRRYKNNFNKFMAGNWSEEFNFTQKEYPKLKFRFASGGTLPIIRLEEKYYYCLFYRDIPPVGWNIANGACDTLVELLYPIDTIERELREEMIIIKPDNNKTDEGIRYVFPIDKDKSQDHPDFAVARKLWKRYFPGISDYIIDEKNIKWEKGPDKVNIQTLLPHVSDDITGCFININVEDLGIEFDRVAIINLEDGEIILDGEILKGKLLNRIIGLFEIDRINKNLEGEYQFIPEHFFHTGKFYRNGKHIKDPNIKDVKDAIKPFITKLANIRTEVEKELYRKEKLHNKHLDLCPVTRSIIKRINTDKQLMRDMLNINE